MRSTKLELASVRAFALIVNRIWVHSDRMKVLGARRDGKSYPQGHSKASGPRKES